MGKKNSKLKTDDIKQLARQTYCKFFQLFSNKMEFFMYFAKFALPLDSVFSFYFGPVDKK